MEQEKNLEQHYNLLEILSLGEQASLIHAMNDFLGNLDLRLTDDPYFQFSCTIDQDGDLVLLPNDMKLTWIDLKQLIPFDAQKTLKEILELHFPGKSSSIVKNIKLGLKDLFTRDRNRNAGHILGNPEAFAFQDLSPKMRWQIMDTVGRRLLSLLKPVKLFALKTAKDYPVDEYVILAHINHMLGERRNEYFSMDKEQGNKLFLNRKGCIYLSKIYRAVFHWLGKDKEFFDLQTMYGSHYYPLVQKLLSGKDLTDHELISLIACIDEILDQCDDHRKDALKAQFGTVNDLVFASHFSYHSNRLDFFEYQIAPQLPQFTQGLTQSTEAMTQQHANSLEAGDYVMFHEIAPLKDLVSMAIKSLRGKDRVFDIMRGRTILNQNIFDRNDPNKKTMIIDHIGAVFQSVEQELQAMCTRIGMKQVSITKELDNKYKKTLSTDDAEEIGRKAFSGKHFAMRRSSRKTLQFNKDNIQVVEMVCGSGLPIEKIYRALSEAVTGAIDGYEDMKVIFTIKGYDAGGTPIEFGYEHMLVFSDYSNEHPSSSHMMKLDPHKVINGLTREAAVTTQYEFYSMHIAGVQSFCAMMKERKDYLFYAKELKIPFKGKYPYAYIKDQFTRNNHFRLDTNEVIEFSEINFSRTDDILLVQRYIAQSFREFVQQGKHHLFVRTKARYENRTDKDQLLEQTRFGDIYERGCDINGLEDFLMDLDARELTLVGQTNGNMVRQLITMTLPSQGEIGVYVDGRIYWIPVEKASYLMRMLHPSAKEKLVWNFDTSTFEKKSKQ